MTHNLQDLIAAAARLSGRDQEFALSLAAGWRRYGSLTERQAPHAERLIALAARGGQPEAPKVAGIVGDLSGILALFDRAKKHLKFPAIVLSIPALGEFAVRINIAGERARVPGSLTIVDADKPDDGSRREWIGRVLLGGAFQSGHSVDARREGAILARLRAFAAEPARIAAEHGRLTGRCCFCNRPLTDERSTAVGYGSTCATHYGLPWGSRAGAVLAQAVEAEAVRRTQAAGVPLEHASAAFIESDMQRAEAEGDRLGTIRDEANKHEARRAMEHDGTEDHEVMARRERRADSRNNLIELAREFEARARG